MDVHAERNYGVSKCLDKRRLPHHTRGSGTTWQVRKTTPTAPSAAIDSSSHNNLPYVEKRSTPNCLGPVHKQHPTAQDKPSMRSCDEPLKMVSLSSGTRTTRGKRACWHVVAVRKRHGMEARGVETFGTKNLSPGDSLCCTGRQRMDTTTGYRPML